VREVGRVATIADRALADLFRPHARLDLAIVQMEGIGVPSLPIIVLAGAFTGAVVTHESAFAAACFGAEGVVSGSVGVALTRELAPTWLPGSSARRTGWGASGRAPGEGRAGADPGPTMACRPARTAADDAPDPRSRATLVARRRDVTDDVEPWWSRVTPIGSGGDECDVDAIDDQGGSGGDARALDQRWLPTKRWSSAGGCSPARWSTTVPSL